MNDLNKVLGKLTYGLYVLTTNNGGCMVDAVCQISSGEYPLISVSVNKNNNTNQLMTENDKFALSIFGMESDPEIIKYCQGHKINIDLGTPTSCKVALFNLETLEPVYFYENNPINFE